jgi:hypothetical protein
MIDHHQIGGGVVELGVVRQDVPASGSTGITASDTIFLSVAENSRVIQAARANLATPVGASQSVGVLESVAASTTTTIFISASDAASVSQKAPAGIVIPASANQSVGATESTLVSTVQSATITASESTNITQSAPANVLTNDPPSAALTDSSTSGTQVTWDATGSTDPNGDSLKFRFDFTNDGTYDTTFRTSGTITHDYGSQGTFTAKVQVDDGRGGRDTATHTVSVFGTN